MLFGAFKVIRRTLGEKLVDQEVASLFQLHFMEDIEKAHGYRMTNRREALT